MRFCGPGFSLMPARARSVAFARTDRGGRRGGAAIYYGNVVSIGYTMRRAMRGGARARYAIRNGAPPYSYTAVCDARDGAPEDAELPPNP